MGTGKSKFLPASVRSYLAATRSPAVSIAVTLPLLLIYNVGLLMPGTKEMNASDFLSRIVFHFFGIKGIVILNCVLTVLSVALVVWLIRRNRFRYGQWAALCAEGLLYGFILWFSVQWTIGHILGPLSAGARSYSIMQALSVSAGAGYWEELVFRLLLVGVPVILTTRFGDGKATKVASVAFFAIVLSSLLFSLAHYAGGMETPTWFSFWYRALSGVVFSIIFLLRGFAVTAYTHFLYDFVIFVF